MTDYVETDVILFKQKLERSRYNTYRREATHLGRMRAENTGRNNPEALGSKTVLQAKEAALTGVMGELIARDIYDARNESGELLWDRGTNLGWELNDWYWLGRADFSKLAEVKDRGRSGGDILVEGSWMYGADTPHYIDVKTRRFADIAHQKWINDPDIIIDPKKGHDTNTDYWFIVVNATGEGDVIVQHCLARLEAVKKNWQRIEYKRNPWGYAMNIKPLSIFGQEIEVETF